jgi:hypothetical protein
VDALIRRVEDKAVEVPDQLLAAIAIVHLLNREADPYLLIGALVDAIATTVAERIPAERHGEVSVATARLLQDLLEAIRKM